MSKMTALYLPKIWVIDDVTPVWSSPEMVMRMISCCFMSVKGLFFIVRQMYNKNRILPIAAEIAGIKYNHSSGSFCSLVHRTRGA